MLIFLIRLKLEGANPSSALVNRVTLDNAKFKNAISTGATLTRSRFFGGNITGADSDTFIVCDRATGTNPLTASSN